MINLEFSMKTRMSTIFFMIKSENEGLIVPLVYSSKDISKV
jgi:hypothetical protein